MASNLAAWPSRPAARTPQCQTGWFGEMFKALRRNRHIRPLITQVFRALQQVGINVTPHHFYWPIPDLAELERRRWPVAAEICGLDLGWERQLRFLSEVVPQFAAELNFAPAANGCAWEYHRNNGLFEAVDAEVAHAMVRHLRPARVIEVGGGYSTRLIAGALRYNAQEGAGGELITIEPHPDPVLRAGFPGLTQLIAEPVQTVGLDPFGALGSGDILFLDSSHVVGVGSDVVYEYLEILPRIAAGVVVHAHDIFLPADYPRSAVLDGLCFWSEQYLLQAFLTLNPCFEVLWGSSAMYLRHPELLDAAFPALRDSFRTMPAGARQFQATNDGKRIWPSSFWMRRSEPRVASPEWP